VLDIHGFFAATRYAPLDWLVTHPRRRRLARDGRSALRGGLAVGLVLALAIGLGLWHRADRAQAPVGPPPHIDAPFARAALRPLTARQALTWNQRIADTRAPVPAARAFLAPGAGVEDQARAQQCLASAVYYEAGSESIDGQRAVAQVVLNRVRHPAYPHSVCGVVWQGSERPQGCQFTFTCDGALARRPDATGWGRAMEIAREALNGYVFTPVGWATHYHANYVVPYWASSLQKITQIGAHIFYRWDGGWGRPGAFGAAYAGREPLILPALIHPAEAAVPVATAAGDAPAADKPVAAFDRPVLTNNAARAADGDDVPRPAVAARPAARWILEDPAPVTPPK